MYPSYLLNVVSAAVEALKNCCDQEAPNVYLNVIHYIYIIEVC